jgi:sugar/nucleoside kinase (ribokinase family)
MDSSAFIEPVDYLAIGHISCDLTPDGARIGGSVSYAALIAKSLGLKVGIVTAWGEDIPLGLLSDIPIAGIVSSHSTTFDNLKTSRGRVQTLHHLAPSIDYQLIPETWRTAPIVHLAPVAQEISPSIIQNFPRSFISVSAQGWLRDWADDGRVFASEFTAAHDFLEKTSAVVISIEDLENDLNRAKVMSTSCPLLAVTLGAEGANVYWREDIRKIAAPLAQEIDSVGAGDIFAAGFFIHYYNTGDPWKAALFANQLASSSVSHIGLASTILVHTWPKMINAY